MKPGRMLPVMQPEPAPAHVSRRSALQALATGLGAGLAAPVLADAHPVQPHMAHAAAALPAPVDQGPFTPAFLDAHQFATLQVIADLLVPGATPTGTPEFLDKLLAVESVETRRRFVTALGAMDGAAIEAHRRPFKDLSSGEQTALLTTAAGMAPSRPVVYWTKGDPIPVPQPPAGPTNLRDHFDHLKGWVAGIYFASEPGLRELGWTGLMFFESFTGCDTAG
jgi:hypothetical protein